jgi:hypothetical protein
MVTRLLAMRRALKSTGSIYLHCDLTASHYLKLVMDAIFGNSGENRDKPGFRNEVIWAYRTGGVSKKRWPSKHDVLLFYAKGAAQIIIRPKSGFSKTSLFSLTKLTKMVDTMPTCISGTYGMTSSPSSTYRRNDLATRRRNRWPSWSAS